jgi:hypothetical protein
MRKARGPTPAGTPRRPQLPRSLRQHLSVFLRQPVAAPADVVTGSLLLVTTRHMPLSSMSYRVLAQVMTPRDPLPGASHRNNRAMRFVHLPVPQRASFDLARSPRTPEPWVMAHSKDRLPTGSALDANATCRAGKQQKQRHKTGLVSRVPRSARPAQAGKTDRNTNRTCSTHQGQLSNEQGGHDERPEL